MKLTKQNKHIPTNVLLSFAAGQFQGHVTFNGVLQVKDSAILNHYHRWK